VLLRLLKKASRDGTFSSRDPTVDIFFVPRWAAPESNPRPPDSLLSPMSCFNAVLSLCYPSCALGIGLGRRLSFSLAGFWRASF
jgi:hypothetical protein